MFPDLYVLVKPSKKPDHIEAIVIDRKSFSTVLHKSINVVGLHADVRINNARLRLPVEYVVAIHGIQKEESNG